jgi:hypothetical protein
MIPAEKFTAITERKRPAMFTLRAAICRKTSLHLSLVKNQLQR